MATRNTRSRRKPARRAHKPGPVAFQDRLVDGLQRLSQSRSTARRVVRDTAGSTQENLQSRIADAREQAQEAWGNLETLFQQKVQHAMHRLGVPTAGEIRELTQRVAELNENVARLNDAARRRKSPGARGRAGRGPRGRGAASTRTATK
jgi:Poly(hydroxyalcanoate) granule associated protein (phasin).